MIRVNTAEKRTKIVRIVLNAINNQSEEDNIKRELKYSKKKKEKKFIYDNQVMIMG